MSGMRWSSVSLRAVSTLPAFSCSMRMPVPAVKESSAARSGRARLPALNTTIASAPGAVFFFAHAASVAVGVAGTIRGACEQCEMSYRTCINRIRHMERILGAPILEISRGGSEHGGAKLTPLARRLIDVYHEWHRAIVEASDNAARRLLKA